MDKKLKIHHLSFIIRKSRGFTLIELLVAIGIIGMLSAFLLANFVGVRQRARDGVRKSDLRQIQAALELYRSDQGKYPKRAESRLSCGNSLAEGAVTYMKKIPCDPLDPLKGGYIYSSDEITYSIYACLENGNDSQIDKDKDGKRINCLDTTLWKYTLQNP